MAELLGAPTDPGVYYAWLIWILPFAAALIIPAVGKGSKKATGYVAIGLALVSAISAALLLPTAFAGHEIHNQIPWISSIGINAGVLADPLAIIMANVVGWISFLILVYSTGYMKGDKDIVRFWFWMMFFIGSMQLIVLSDNFLQLFFGWEGVGLASYALIGFWYRDKKKHHVGQEGRTTLGLLDYYSPTHSGMKAFIMTKVGDIMMLAGMFLIFAFAGTFGFKELLADTGWATTMAAQGLLVPAAVLLFGGAIGKSAQFPLNEWLLEAMTGPTSVSALIHAATMVKAGVFLVARLGPLFFALGAAGILMDQFFEIIAWVGAITALLLATQAMVNPEIKKVLAYSTGSQIGFMMMALGVAGLSQQFVDGYTAGFFHLISHAIFKASLFMAAGSLLHIVGSRFMTDMGGLRKHMKKTYGPRVSPFLDVREAGALLQRAGFSLPVVDLDTITVTWPDALALMKDLRGMGEANAVLERKKSFTRRGTLLSAAAGYQARHGDAEGRIPATFQIVYLTGWAPHDSQQRPLRPGAATSRLADALDVAEVSAGEKAKPGC